MAGRMYKRKIDLMEAELGDELVALDPDAGECFGFNSIATSVWRMLEGADAIGALCMERMTSPPFGLLGGKAGAAAEVMLTTPVKPRYVLFCRNVRKFSREAQSTVNRFGRKLGSDPVTHCAANAATG